jgi:hypothetical protein
MKRSSFRDSDSSGSSSTYSSSTDSSSTSSTSSSDSSSDSFDEDACARARKIPRIDAKTVHKARVAKAKAICQANALKIEAIKASKAKKTEAKAAKAAKATKATKVDKADKADKARKVKTSGFKTADALEWLADRAAFGIVDLVALH